ncbi:MAG TPA: type II toxin-antitoxin system RelE/ParE family toxin [Arthrobacter sp.]
MAATNLGHHRHPAQPSEHLRPSPACIVSRHPRDAGVSRTGAQPPGSLKLAGAERLWRLRVGGYRVIYRIEDAVQMVLVIAVGHRRDGPPRWNPPR